MQLLQKMCRKSAGITENLQKICRQCRKSAENLQLLQKICRYCRKSAAIAENLQVLRKCAGITENLQVLRKMCRKSAGIAENVQVLQKICRTSVDIAELGQSGQQMPHSYTTVFSFKMIFITLLKFTSGTYSSTPLFKSFFSSLMVIALRANSLIIHMKVTCEGFTTLFQVFLLHMPLHTIFSSEGLITVKTFHSMLLCFTVFDVTVVLPRFVF